MQTIRSDELRPFIDEYDIRVRIDGLVRQMANELPGNTCVLVGVLKKSFIFMADLMRQFHACGTSLWVDFITLDSDKSETLSAGPVTVERDITLDIRDKSVILVDDVLDTGHTALVVRDHLLAKGPRLLKTCVLLDKLKKRETDFQPDYVGFTVPDVFVVGYGLGYKYTCRELPSISIAAFEEIDLPLEFSVKRSAIFLKGCLDQAGSDYIRETLLHWKGDLRLDLWGLESIDSEGLGLFSEVLDESEKSGRRLVFLNAGPEIRNSIERAGFKQPVVFE
jgi:hypoxanthine phosphoribosyltransferase